MGQHVVTTIYNVIRGFPKCKELGYFKVSVESDVIKCIVLDQIGDVLRNGSVLCQSQAMRLSATGCNSLEGLTCCVQMDSKSESTFKIPELNWQDTKLDPREMFRSTVQNAPKTAEIIPYFIIAADGSSDWRSSAGLPTKTFLDCGERLRMTAGKVPGIHTTYEHISGGARSPTGMHVEDGHLGSINFVLAGAPKIWLFIAPHYGEKFELAIRQSALPGRKHQCSQFVRHLDLLVSPDLLDEWGIEYSIVPCKAGEMIATLPGTYHQVLNAGPNFAEAINCAMQPDWNGVSEDYRFCSEERCAEQAVTDSHLKFPPTSDHPKVQEPEKPGENSSKPADPSDVVESNSRSHSGNIVMSEQAAAACTGAKNLGPQLKTPQRSNEESQPNLPEPVNVIELPKLNPKDTLSMQTSRDTRLLTPKSQRVEDEIEQLVDILSRHAHLVGLRIEDIECLRIRGWLNETIILSIMERRLTRNAQAKIATQCIEHFPRGGLSERFDATSGPVPILNHDVSSDCQMIFYNLRVTHESHSLWTLIIVDIRHCGIHVYGTENVSDQDAQITALNIAKFVNEYRTSEQLEEIDWRYHRAQPVRTIPNTQCYLKEG